MHLYTTADMDSPLRNKTHCVVVELHFTVEWQCHYIITIVWTFETRCLHQPEKILSLVYVYMKRLLPFIPFALIGSSSLVVIGTGTASASAMMEGDIPKSTTLAVPCSLFCVGGIAMIYFLQRQK